MAPEWRFTWRATAEGIGNCVKRAFILANGRRWLMIIIYIYMPYTTNAYTAICL